MKYLHNYKGIVIQNDDPDFMGRVKVYVPDINMTLYDKWNADKTIDKEFTILGKNTNSALNQEILKRLKESLPWAMIKHPLIGMGTTGFYNAGTDYTEISNDSNQSKQSTLINPASANNLPTGNPPPGPPSIIKNPTKNKGGGGSDLFTFITLSSTILPQNTLLQNNIFGSNLLSMQSCNYGTKLDTVLDPNKIRGCNQQLPACYLPPIIANTQGNKVKGMMSIPAVGSHVSVYFDAGDVQYPIIDGYFYSQEDIKGIFDIQN